jgi:hypothetical protein
MEWEGGGGGHTLEEKNAPNGLSLFAQADRYGFLGGNQYTDPDA